MQKIIPRRFFKQIHLWYGFGAKRADSFTNECDLCVVAEKKWKRARVMTALDGVENLLLSESVGINESVYLAIISFIHERGCWLTINTLSFIS